MLSHNLQQCYIQCKLWVLDEGIVPFVKALNPHFICLFISAGCQGWILSLSKLDKGSLKQENEL